MKLRVHYEYRSKVRTKVFNLHYVIGDYRGALSFGDPYEEDE